MASASRVTLLRPKRGGISAMRKVLSEMQRVVERDGVQVIDELARKTVEEAKLRAPRATGELEDAIQIRDGGRGGTSKLVYVDEGKAPYAYWMHEGMFDFYSDGKYFLGPGSLAKNPAHAHEEPRGVGIKFLERAGHAVAEDAMRTTWRRHVSAVLGRIRALSRRILGS